MNRPDDIDAFFRQQLNKLPDPVIPEHYLADMNQRLDTLEKRKRKGVFWFWFIPGILLCATGLTWALGKNAKSTAANSSGPAMIVVPEPGQQNNTRIPSAGVSEKNTGNSFSVLHKKDIAPHQLHRNNTTAPNPVKKNSFISLAASSEKTTGKTETNETVADRNDPINTEGLPSGSPTKSAGAITVENTADSTASNTPSTLPTPKAQNKAAQNAGFSIELLAGTQLVVNTFPGADDSEYSAKRKAEEKRIFGADFSAVLGKKFNRWLFGAGLNYSEWGEKIKYSPRIVQTEKLVTIIDTTSDDTTTYAVPVETVDNEITRHNNINKYRYVSLLLSAGYTFNVTGKFSISPKASLLAGFLTGSKYGYYLDRNGLEIQQTQVNTLLINAQVSTEFALNIKSCSVLLSPYYRANINMPVGPGSLQNRYRSFGIQAGLRFNL